VDVELVIVLCLLRYYSNILVTLPTAVSLFGENTTQRVTAVILGSSLISNNEEHLMVYDGLSVKHLS